MNLGKCNDLLFLNEFDDGSFISYYYENVNSINQSRFNANNLRSKA